MASLHRWRWCPRCRTELELEDGSASCPACGFRQYAASAPTASALPVDDRGRVLLARRAIEPDKGKWDIVGGFLEEGEHPLDGLRREVREETGLEAEPLEFLTANVDRYGEGDDAVWTLNLVWTARVPGGEPEAADDVAELRWFAPDELPPPEACAFEHVAGVLRAWRDEQA
ncbi:MAG TPA: NUDIX domain-containing protein [Gaiellaceae bacterium]|nr:NUDIX domain-containing protein [Gaiellaceae bacterium]